MLDDCFQLFAVIGDAAAGAAQGKSGPDDERETADLGCDALGIGGRAGDPRAGHVQSDPDHCFLEELTIFALGDGERAGADQLHVVPNERAVAVQLHGGIERGLAAHRGQDRVRFFPFQNRLDDSGVDRLDVSAIGEFRIGHDRGRVGIDEHDLVAFLAQRLAGLHPGIIKLAALPDNDWARADEEDFVQLIVPRHAQRETKQ